VTHHASDVLIAVALVGVLPLVVVALVLVTAPRWYWSRVGRAARLAGPGAWATGCLDPTNPRARRVLVVDGAGVHLWRTSGRELNVWAWPTITHAATGPVRPFGSLVTYQGVHLALVDGSAVELLFPSRSTLRYPHEPLQRAMRELARYGKC
jgi:hypothetical protein